MTRLTADHHFAIGAAHVRDGTPCEDYAQSGLYGGPSGRFAYAVLSDGCSSGGATDMGARLIVHATVAALRETGDTLLGSNDFLDEHIRHERNSTMAKAQKVLRLEGSDMLATCLYAHLSPLGGYAHIAGDGVIAFKYRNGDIRLHRFEWGDNTPYYPIYTGDALTRFVALHGGLSAPSFTEEIWLHEAARAKNEFIKKTAYSTEEGMRGAMLRVTAKEMSKRELAFVALFSDGVTQVDGVDWKEAVVSLLFYKSTEGVFVVRRMKRGLKEFLARGKGAQDDIACAVIRVDDRDDFAE